MKKNLLSFPKTIFHLNPGKKGFSPEDPCAQYLAIITFKINPLMEENYPSGENIQFSQRAEDKCYLKWKSNISKVWK